MSGGHGCIVCSGDCRVKSFRRWQADRTDDRLESQHFFRNLASSLEHFEQIRLEIRLCRQSKLAEGKTLGNHSNCLAIDISDSVRIIFATRNYTKRLVCFKNCLVDRIIGIKRSMVEYELHDFE